MSFHFLKSVCHNAHGVHFMALQFTRFLSFCASLSCAEPAAVSFCCVVEVLQILLLHVSLGSVLGTFCGRREVRIGVHFFQIVL